MHPLQVCEPEVATDGARKCANSALVQADLLCRIALARLRKPEETLAEQTVAAHDGWEQRIVEDEYCPTITIIGFYLANAPT